MTARREIYSAIIVGGGPAGMAAAVAARARGLERVMIIEREEYLGGVLPQCVHDGFGLHIFGQSLTGPEYASTWEAIVHEYEIEVCLSTTVFSVDRARNGEYIVNAVGITLGGQRDLRAQSVIVATGCKERTRGQMLIPGTRPSGVLTAGTAQYMINVRNQLPGDRVVILGSGDIGLIVARRLTLEGAEVRLVLGQEATGLMRNHIRCIQDFDIPIRYGWGVVSISGRAQLRGVRVAPLNADGSFDLPHSEYVQCNTLLLACGLIPEREVLRKVSIDDEGFYLCGNANTPMDLVDQVTKQAIETGIACADYVLTAYGFALPRPLPSFLCTISAIEPEEPKGRVSQVFETSSTEGDCQDGTRFIVCTVCPTGCVMQVSKEGVVQNNACARGKEYAQAEIERPMRIFTGTIKMVSDSNVVVPVRTAREVLQSSLSAIARACRKIQAPWEVRCGEVVRENVANTNVDLIATASMNGEQRVPTDGVSLIGLSLYKVSHD